MDPSSEPLLRQGCPSVPTPAPSATDIDHSVNSSERSNAAALPHVGLGMEAGGGHGGGHFHSRSKKLSSSRKTLGNMVVSIVGCGVLGLPYAFCKSGWAFSLAALAFMALVSYYGMLLLVRTRKILEAQLRESLVLGGRPSPSPSPLQSVPETTDLDPLALGEGERPPWEGAEGEAEGELEGEAPDALDDVSTHRSLSWKPAPHLEDGGNGYFLKVTSYGELGYRVMGTMGQVAVDFMVCISQAGFCVAYLIFIGENITLPATLVGARSSKLIVITCVAVLQVFLSWVRSLSKLARFSIVAVTVNLCAFSVVIFYGLSNLKAFPTLHAFTGLKNAPAALGVAVYSFEGVGMTLALEASMKEPLAFPSVLAMGVSVIAAMYGSVGLMGYTAFGEHTHQIVTLDLPKGWATTSVQLGLSLALCFTFPVMMHPVYEVYETRLCQQDFVRNHILPSTILRRLMFRTLRAIIIFTVAYVALGVPHFATFISLIGSSVCSLLGFIFPAIFHLRVGSKTVSPLERVLDYFLIIFGSAFAVWGTWDSVHQLILLYKNVNFQD